MLIKLIVAVLFFSQFMLILPAAASEINPTQVTQVLAGPHYGNKVIITISNKPQSIPSCQTNPRYSYVFDASTESGKVTLSLVLTAYASGKNVWLGGLERCDLYSGIESLKHIVVL
jgi:hypothetical protein